MKRQIKFRGMLFVLLIVACICMQPVSAETEAMSGTAPAADVISTEALPGTAPAAAAGLTTSAISTAAISPVVTEVGKISWSIDGLGMNPASTGIIQVEKPAGATVRSAYMAAAGTGWNSYSFIPGSIKIDGANVVWTNQIDNYISSHNAWADVTALVKPKLDAAAPGRVNFEIVEASTGAIDGELLVVIFNDPAQTTDNTVVLSFGAQRLTGDDFNIGLSEPIDTTDPNLALDLSLASTFSNQDNDDQYSIVDVNSMRLTSWAGGNDDTINAMTNGNLFTVGGLDDSNANPADPNAKPVGNKRYDDELYSLLPFVANGDVLIKVHTQNPSNDDNIMFAGLYLKSATAVVGRGIVLSPASATNQLGQMHTLTAKVQDDTGNPISGETVTFTITSGPNAGTTGSAVTDADGIATFSYTSTQEGTDTIVATIGADTTLIRSNEATKTWKEGNNVPEFPSLILPVGLLAALVLVVMNIRRK